jgi:Flp pilus assembly protein TadG
VSRLSRRWRNRRLDQRGYVAILVAFLLPTVFMACAAFAVDTGNWYAQQKDIQKAADAAALAGVPYLPNDLTDATIKAIAVAKTNGYDDADPNVTVTVGLGSRPTQLKVTISAVVSNTFGRVIGHPSETLTQSAVADYQGPQPMGSPCNTFGNEPTSGTGGSSPTPSGSALGAAPFTNCSSTPQFWGVIEGPETDKIQGDEFQTTNCSSGVDNCTGGSNDEYEDFGYSYVVKVQPAAVNTPITLQLYDPEFANTNGDFNSSDSTPSGLCGALPPTSSWPSTSGNINPYVTKADARNRYAGPSSSNTGQAFCNGDYFPGSSGSPTPPTTTFVLRQTVPSNDPAQAAVQNDTSGTPCIKQYGGLDPTWSTNLLTSGASGYNAQLAQVFHNWTTFCTFTPTSAGDYYLQVRTNVSLGGTGSGILYSGNAAAAAATGNTSTGEGANTFAMRAVTNAGLETSVAVAGYSHMPIDINAAGSTSTFNLIRVAPGAAGQFISFSFFDAGDATGNGAIKILPPTDATGSITSTPFPGSCAATGGAAGGGTTLSNCNAPISNSTNNGKLETVTVPVPSDYNCNYASFGGCWYRVQITFQGASAVTDVTTWNATVVGDPVRLVQ